MYEIACAWCVLVNKTYLLQKMVRNYKKKRLEEVDESNMEKAVLEVVSGNMKLRRAAEIYYTIE